ncbi:MAG: FecR domain-containing protein [Pseudomonadota bacterium]
MRVGLALLATAALLPLQAAADIGSVAAVNRDMSGTPPGAERRDLLLGNVVVAEELVQTSTIGSGQLMFLDQTTLTVAPSSNIVLDSYVYDPDQQTGEMAISIARGTLRFIGGRISKTTDVEVTTPNATIGIRGGMVLIEVTEDGTTRVIITAGEYVTILDQNGRRIILSRQNAMAEIGPDGFGEYIGLAPTSTLARLYRLLEGRGDGGSQFGQNEQGTQAGTLAVERLNSGTPDGEKQAPISTSGEREINIPGEEIILANLAQDPDDDQFTDGDPSDSPAQAPTPTTAGGAVFLPSLGVQPFVSVTAGSRIGTSATGEVVTIPVPSTQADFISLFSNGTAPNLFAIGVAPNGGIFEFGLSSATEGTTTSAGNLFGGGFTDLADDFHFYQITTSNESEDGIVFFGTPTVGQLSVSPLNDGVPATANTAARLIIEPSLVGGSGNETQFPLLLIANGGEARFAHQTHDLASNSGAILGAEVSLDVSGDGETLRTTSTFTVVAPRIFNDGTGGLRIGGVSRTTQLNSTQGMTIIGSNFGTFEDANRNTVFGQTNNYLVISSLRRAANGVADGSAPFDTQDFGTRRNLGGVLRNEGGFASMVTVDPAGNFAVNDPFPRALGPATAVTAANQINSFPVSPIMAGSAAGFALCSNLNCGQLASGPTGRTGFMGLNGLAVATFLESTAAVDANNVLFAMELTSPDPAELNPNPNQEAAWSFVGVPTQNENTVYLDDRRFGGTAVLPGTAAGVSVDAVEFQFATFDVAGDLGASTVANLPEYATFGWWSASYNAFEPNGPRREDGVHLGTFVVGAVPNPDLIPNNAIVSYSGLAIGQQISADGGLPALVSGDFTATYNFARATGDFAINIAGGSFQGLNMVGDPAAGHAYTVNSLEEVANVSVSGNFYAGGNDPVAATGGDFRIDDFERGQVVTGVFGGDAVSD